MGSHEVEAWVLHRGKRGVQEPGQLMRESFEVGPLASGEVRVEPLYGSWEGNMTHALLRDPVDICRFRRESRVVVGNAGVVRVIEPGPGVHELSSGQVCLVFGNAVPDAAGYMVKALAYDAPKTMGVLAKQARMPQHCLIPIPKGTKFALAQWAAFSLRYITAWSNWRLAFGAYRLQMTEADCPEPFVMGWGGGVTFAQLTLAQLAGCKTAMVASRTRRLEQLEAFGITGIDRRKFSGLYFDPDRFTTDPSYKKSYLAAEKEFVAAVREASGGAEVAVFLDHIGAPLYRATMAVLGRQGVITSAGWKEGAALTKISRSTECTLRRNQINTHYARYQEGVEAVAFAEAHGWLPPVEPEAIYPWDEVPQLAADHAAGKIDSYFPLFAVNAP